MALTVPDMAQRSGFAERDVELEAHRLERAAKLRRVPVYRVWSGETVEGWARVRES